MYVATRGQKTMWLIYYSFAMLYKWMDNYAGISFSFNIINAENCHAHNHKHDTPEFSRYIILYHI